MHDRIDPSHARDALYAIDPNCSRDQWHSIGRAAISAGLTVDDIDEWSRSAPNYSGERDVRSAFKGIAPTGGTGPGTLWKAALSNGWKPPQREQSRRHSRPKKAPQKFHAPSAVWSRCEPAADAHPYIVAKQGRPDGLRVVPEGDLLKVAGMSMAGALVVPVLPLSGGEPVSLQFIGTPEQAARWKAQGRPSKLNMPGSPMEGVFVVGDMLVANPTFVCEGLGQAWAIWKATGRAAVCCFGWGRVRAVAAELRERDASARLVLVPDAGKEDEAERIALDVRGEFVTMPEGSPSNFDANDYAQREGFDALEVLLAETREPSRPEPRFKLLGGADLHAMPPMKWRIRGVLPALGLASVYGASGSGKSFLALDMAAAIAEGHEWFGYRAYAAPVAYVVLEGEAGFRLRVAAWEKANGRTLPDGLRLVLQPFKLTEPDDVEDLADAVLAAGGGAVTVLDTLNRAAPECDENASADMGRIIEAAKELQRRTDGLVVAVHHSGKDVSKGLRGHSSLRAALDAAVEVNRNGDRRDWKVDKAKDGADGDTHPFNLRVVELAPDIDGEPVTSCVVCRDDSASEIQRAPVAQGGNQRLVYDGIKGLFKEGFTGKPGAPPLRPCIQLEAAVAAGAGRLTCASDKRTSRAREAITGLVARGVLGLNEGWLWTA